MTKNSSSSRARNCPDDPGQTRPRAATAETPRFSAVWTTRLTLHTSGRVNNLVQELDDPEKAATVEPPQFSALSPQALVVAQKRACRQPCPRLNHLHDFLSDLRHDQNLHDLWYWHTTICSTKKRTSGISSTASMVCGTGTPRAPTGTTPSLSMNCNCGISTVSCITNASSTSENGATHCCRFRQFPLPPLLLPLCTGGRGGVVDPATPSLPVSRTDRGTHEDQVLDPVNLLLVLRHEGEDIHQLFCHQRHRSIERGHDRRTVDELLHSAPLHPLLRPDVGETVRPRPAGLFFIEAEELRLGCGGSRIMAV